MIKHSVSVENLFNKTAIEEWPSLFRQMTDPAQRAQVLFSLNEGDREHILKALSPEEIAQLLLEIDSDDAADLVGILPDTLQKEILKQLPITDRYFIQQLLKYPEDTAGGIMQVEMAQVSLNATVNDAISRVRELVENDIEVIVVWVVDSEFHLVGIIELVDLLLNKTTTSISEIMTKDFISVKPLVDQEEVAALFQKHDLLALPVVDEDNHLLGRIVVDDIVDVLAEEADEDALHMGGTSLEELHHRESIFSTARIRLPWLSVSLFCSLISAFLLHLFAPFLEKAVIIVSFLPVISAMGGNVGIQSATLLIRGFSSGKVGLPEIPRILIKELGAGILMGTFYGLTTGSIATFVLSNNNFYLGLTVAVSMIIGMATATTLGVLVPALLKRLGIDPAIASGPFITTMNDITGILIYLTTAGIFLYHG